MHQKMQNRLPVEVTHANREQVVGFKLNIMFLGPPAQFVRHCRMGVNWRSKTAGAKNL
jgi:hypothetical protein